MAILTSIGNGLRSVVEIVLPWLARGRWRGVVGIFRWVLHFLCVVAILLTLGYANFAFGLEQALRSPWRPLATVWPPLLFLLLYVGCWLGYWFRQLLSSERAVSCPEIEAAWKEAMQALRHAGIDIARVPVYLVLGRPASGEESLFEAGHLRLTVQATPSRANAPLRVCATRDAVYVTCAGVSLLGHQANHLAELTGKSGSEPPMLTDETIVQTLRGRLQQLCGLIVNARRPYCPVNGMFVLVPMATMQGEVEAEQVATLFRLDLEAVREVLQVECPVAVVLCDLEEVRGFDEFLARLGAARKSQPLGQRFALVPDVDPQELPAMFERGVDHLCQKQLAALVHALFRLDPELSMDNARGNDAFRKNLGLFQFLARMREVRRGLVRILERGAILDPEAPPMVAGVYLSGTGVDASGQAFVAGIFEDMQKNQNFVAWTPHALAAESALRRMTRLGYATLVVILLLVAGTAYRFLWNA